MSLRSRAAMIFTAMTVVGAMYSPPLDRFALAATHDNRRPQKEKASKKNRGKGRSCRRSR